MSHVCKKNYMTNITQLTDSITFRTSAELKMYYIEKAQQLGIHLSEYITLALKEYERIKDHKINVIKKENEGDELTLSDIHLNTQEIDDKVRMILEILQEEKAPKEEKTDLTKPLKLDLVPVSIDVEAIKNEERERIYKETIIIDNASPELKGLFEEVLAYRQEKDCTLSKTPGEFLAYLLKESLSGVFKTTPKGFDEKIEAICEELKGEEKED